MYLNHKNKNYYKALPSEAFVVTQTLLHTVSVDKCRHTWLEPTVE